MAITHAPTSNSIDLKNREGERTETNVGQRPKNMVWCLVVAFVGLRCPLTPFLTFGVRLGFRAVGHCAYISSSRARGALQVHKVRARITLLCVCGSLLFGLGRLLSRFLIERESCAKVAQSHFLHSSLKQCKQKFFQ